MIHRQVHNRWHLPWLALVIALILTCSAQAQREPRIGYVYPPGGRQGNTVQVTVGGQFLDGVTNAFVSGKGIRATVADFNKPMNQGQFNLLRDKLKELQDRKQAAQRDNRKPSHGAGTEKSTNVWTTADEKALVEVREKMLKNPPNRMGTPAIAETVHVRIALSADAEPGEHEIRLGTPAGLSNPLKFLVGQLPEFAEPTAQAANPDLDRFLERLGRPTTQPPARSEMRITLPASVNGQIMPGTVDRYRFTARKGQQVVAAVSARALIPYLADAVPGWFQATLALYDAKGKELAYDDDFRFNPDPVLFFQIPKDGEYALEIKDAIYRGREDFVYRITVGELPFVTSVFPLGGPAGAKTEVELKGWNLPINRLTLNDEKQSPGIRALCVRTNDWVSNLMPFAVDILPECLEKESNNEPRKAQAISLPIIINGHVDAPGDTDVFRFDGRAGQEIVVEVWARRLNSPVDSQLRLTDADGKQVAFNDDLEDKASGLNTHHADSYLRAALPADGPYFVQLADTQRQGGPEYGYRLRLSPPRPDFELRLVPSSLSVRAGLNAPFTVHALRKDGFTNEIELVLRDAPEGFKLSGARLPAGQDEIKLTLTVPPSPSDEAYDLVVEGRAKIAGRDVVHRAVPADDLMQAFLYRHLVPAQELKLVAPGRWFPRGTVKVLGKTPVQIPAGGDTRVRLAMPMGRFANRFHLELSEPPEGVTLGELVPTRDGAELVLKGDAAKVKAGLTGNLIVNVFPTRPPGNGKNRPQAGARLGPIGTLPAIPFEIVSQ